MIPTSLGYTKADSVADALSALDEDAKLLAGGHSLLPALKLRLNEVDKLIDISQIEALQQISLDGGTLSIGAACTHAAIAESALVREQASIFAKVAEQIGDVQVRNVGTIGGSIAHADPAADWPAALLAGGASVHVQSSQGSRAIAAEDFFLGLYMTALGEDEIITHISVPSMASWSSSYQKFAQPASRFAIAGCAVAVRLDGGQVAQASVAFAGVAAKPYRDTSAAGALVGKALTSDHIQAAVNARDTSVQAMSDHFASQGYRTHLAGVMLGKALSAIA